jgi:probable rRNA maturation factor
VFHVPAARGLSPEPVIGDLAISVDTARKQADEMAHALGIEIKVLMLHGLLHLAGYDHETDDGEMALLEQKLRSKLRLPHGLIERSVRA